MFQGIGCEKGFQHKCEMLPDSYSVVHKQRTFPFALLTQVQADVDKLLAEGIIEKVDHSNWVRPVVIARHPGGGIRLCVDLRYVNKCIYRFVTHFPN